MFQTASEIYRILGHFKHNAKDTSNPIVINYTEYWVDIGQFKLGTKDLHGIGQRVYSTGMI